MLVNVVDGGLRLVVVLFVVIFFAFLVFAVVAERGGQKGRRTSSLTVSQLELLMNLLATSLYSCMYFGVHSCRKKKNAHCQKAANTLTVRVTWKLAKTAKNELMKGSWSWFCRLAVCHSTQKINVHTYLLPTPEGTLQENFHS